MAPQPLRERSYELARAHAALVRAQDTGDGRVLVLTGEPGIGKSALLDAIRRDASELGYAMGSAKADELNQITPGAPILLALRSGPTPLLDDEGFRSLAPLHDKAPWLVDQIAELLEVRAQRGSLLIAIDDLQWADQLSSFAIRALSSRLVGSPVVWVLAARPVSGLQRTGLDVVRLFEGAPFEHLPLTPLSEQAALGLATDLLGAVPVGRPATTLRRLGGNPFLVTQLCQGLAQQEVGDDEIPFSLATALRARVTSLSAGAAELVALAAVWGVPLPFAAARRLTSGSGGELLDHAELAASAGLLEVAADGVTFRHDLLREFVYDGLSETRRSDLHAASIAYLLERGGSAAAAVPHARIAAAHGSRTGVDVLLRAARECRGVTPVTAASLVQEAFAALTPRDADWAQVGEECAEFLSSAQRGTDVTAVVDVLLAEPHSAEFEARLQVLAARALWLTNQFDDMALRTSRALTHSGMSKPARSRLQAAHALALSRVGPMDAAGAAAEAALAAGRTLGDAPTTALALQALGEIAKNEGRHLAAYAHFHDLRLAGAVGHLADEIAALQFLDRFDEAEALLTDAEQKAEAEQTTNLPSLACARLWQDFKQAHFDAATTSAETLIRIGDEFGTSVYRLDAHVVLSTIAVVHGDLDAAEALIARAETEAAAADAVQLPGLMLGRARIAAARGDVTTGAAILHSLVTSHDDAAHTYWPRMLDQLRLYAGLAVAAGQQALAQEAVELAAGVAAHNPGVTSLEGIALQVRGFVRDDVDALAAAVDLLRRAPRPVMLASALADHGAALLAAGHRRQGASRLLEAFAIYRDLEANPAAAAVQRLLAAAGTRTARTPTKVPRPRFGFASLTERELEVADLVSAGHTNRAVARTLHVSTSTVGTHLRSVFSKLDVQSRVQLTNAMNERRRA